jgi:predicted regulator of Ras-like GTPase activity (Roadblock/LC7/MglB family)
VGRHRHVTCVRSDGLSTVLASLLEDRRVVAATLVDLGSGFVLDACSRDPDLRDLELLGAGHADLARAAPALTAERPGAGVTLTVETADGRVHLLREVPDPHGDTLVLAVVLVTGSSRSLARTRQRMAAVPVEALTAGPTLQRRPVDGRWQVDPAEPDVPAVPPEGLPGLDPVVPKVRPVIADGLPGLEPVVPKVRAALVDPIGAGAGEAAPPPAMPVVVTPAPGSREEPTGADV